MAFLLKKDLFVARRREKEFCKEKKVSAAMGGALLHGFRIIGKTSPPFGKKIFL